jgi:TRAP-type C4-dicarboxylate transport system permease small subunit
MLHQHVEMKAQETKAQPRAELSLQLVLWSIWTFAIGGFAYFSYQAEILAHGQVDLVGLGVRTFLAGTVGLLVLTLVEMQLEPERFS